MQKACLGLWDATKDLTLWNCVLITIDEMRAHNEVKDIKKVFIVSLAMVSSYLVLHGIITVTKYEV